jgi:hypothetical protein
MPSGGPAPPPHLAPALIPSGTGGGGGGHCQQDWIHLEYTLQKFFGLLQHELARSPIYIATGLSADAIHGLWFHPLGHTGGNCHAVGVVCASPFILPHSALLQISLAIALCP